MPTAVYGNCVECAFPILLQGENRVSCPACSTINQPVGEATTGARSPLDWLIIGICAIAGAMLLTRDKREK